MKETLVWFLGREDPWRRDRLRTPVFLGFPGGSDGKEFSCNVGDLGSIPELRRSPGEGYRYLLQYSGLEKTMDCIESIMTEWLSLFFQTFTPEGLVYHGLFRLPGYCTHLFAATHRQSRSIRKYPSGSQGDKCFLFCLQCIVAFPSPLDVCVCVYVCVCVKC